MIFTLCFYLFATVTVFSGMMVVSSRNPVHSVLYLILAFFNAAGLFVLLGAEFVAMILVIVYVGAVAVLFLFVVMMLDIDYSELRKGFQKYLPIGGLIGVVLLAELALVGMSWGLVDHVVTDPATAIPALNEMSNTEALGSLIYTKYIFLFQMAGMILLVAMIGAIVLTHRKRPGVKKQNINKQVMRRRGDAYEVVKVKPGQGV
ncbi:NADH-quinone oxidoreductase subunit J [Paremcibacter congregatus]|uniref:NADH-quinone oxidoreductase subunit J n=1 Tax=Paremcibacter congregatus TaxID=2043170 RepID=UPI0030EDBCE6|tara:strand:+ start:8639 stop:9250 length:612 start_codon:yes stop_codon:yes gene_type:complete